MMLNLFFNEFQSKSQEERIFEDVAQEGKPVKLFVDMEFEPQKYPENSTIVSSENWEYDICNMVTIFKRFASELWNSKTNDTIPEESWLEFDSSLPNIKISRHLHNDRIVFKNMDHLYTFMKELESIIFTNVDDQLDKDESKLIVYREKKRKKKRENYFLICWYILIIDY